MLGLEADTTTLGLCSASTQCIHPGYILSTETHPLTPLKAAKQANTDLLPLDRNWQLCVSVTRCQFSSELNIAVAKCKLQFSLGVASPKSKQPFVSKLTQITGCFPERRKQLFERIVRKRLLQNPRLASEPVAMSFCLSFFPCRLPLNGTNVL